MIETSTARFEDGEGEGEDEDEDEGEGEGDGMGLERRDGIRTGTHQVEFRWDQDLLDDVVH
jgi:hypothetical protein